MPTNNVQYFLVIDNLDQFDQDEGVQSGILRMPMAACSEIAGESRLCDGESPSYRPQEHTLFDAFDLHPISDRAPQVGAYYRTILCG